MIYVKEDSSGCCVENKLQGDSGEAAGGGQVKDDGGSEQDSGSKEGAKCQGLDRV